MIGAAKRNLKIFENMLTGILHIPQSAGERTALAGYGCP